MGRLGWKRIAPKIDWPNGCRFAFTVVDDTDRATVENVAPVYDLLGNLGLRTTKTVWTLPSTGLNGGADLDDPGYRSWLLNLQDAGFEIGIHGVAAGAADRTRAAEGLDRFAAVFGHDPGIHANHVGQPQCIYWGADKLNGLPRTTYRLINRVRRDGTRYYGDDENSTWFWGDLCRDRVKYVRRFVFRDVNTLAVDHLMPYHDPRRPYVRYWFSSSEAADVRAFCRLLSERNQDRLVQEGGACIVYTHFAFGYHRDGRLDPRFARLVERLCRLPGWFVPASTLLDHVGSVRGFPEVSTKSMSDSAMQWRWLSERVRHGVA